jgi:hypothetical protein
VRSCTHERTRAPARLSLRAGRRLRRRHSGGGRADVAQRRREAARCPVRDSRRIERRASGRRPGRRGHRRHEADRANDRYCFRGRFESADLIRGVPALDDPHERRRPARTPASARESGRAHSAPDARAARPKRARRDHARFRDRTRISRARLPAHIGALLCCGSGPPARRRLDRRRPRRIRAWQLRSRPADHFATGAAWESMRAAPHVGLSDPGLRIDHAVEHPREVDDKPAVDRALPGGVDRPR